MRRQYGEQNDDKTIARIYELFETRIQLALEDDGNLVSPYVIQKYI